MFGYGHTPIIQHSEDFWDMSSKHIDVLVDAAFLKINYQITRRHISEESNLYY
jgi:hypothetical protein